MQKKTLLQVTLFSLSILVVVMVFSRYYSNNTTSLPKTFLDNVGITLENKNNDNTIKEVYYISKSNNNVYEIMSKTGNIDLEDPSIILMKDVTAKVTFVNSAPIDITSKFAKYNNDTYETNFFKNVLVKHLDHNIKAEDMSVSMKNSLATLSKNVFYNNQSVKIIADKVEIDLLTKDTKIFMDNGYKKVQIIGGK